MLNSIDFSGRPFHFIGVGGIGMSALAYVLAKQKLPVSGSDLRLSHITQRLQEEGVHIFWSQDASNLEFFEAAQATPLDEAPTSFLPQVICSTAIHPENAEYQAAQKLGCPIFHRSDVLAALIQNAQGISVAGTHGKTTTSSLIGHMLLQAGLDPTIVVGGEVNTWGGNAVVGQGPYLVAEADESDGSLVKFVSAIGVVTNVELDHPDHYHSLDQVIDIFKTFAQHSQTLIGCMDCPTVREHLQPTLGYSLDRASGADYTVDCVSYRSDETVARVWERGVILGRLSIKLLGQHNLSNALAAVAVGRLLKLDFATIAKGLATFEGTRRRFEHRGNYNGIVFIDDYAHHPSEIRATLSAARLQTWGKVNPTPRRVVAVFQPHRYTRVLTFLSEFAESFTNADVVVVTDIYSAGESNPGGIDGQKLADLIAAHHPKVHYEPTLPGVSQLLQQLLTPGDLALFLGAGNLNQLLPEVMTCHQTIEQGLSQEWCNQA
jgi:UDP-N-acetylmuramate--alanine ligase